MRKTSLLVCFLVGCSADGGWLAQTPQPQKPATSDSPSAFSPPIALQNVGENTYALQATDGTYDLYVGPGIKAAMLAGGPATAGSGYYKLGGVKLARMDKARKKADKIATFALEDPASSDMSIEIKGTIQGKINVNYFKPGDPCLTGVVQVFMDSTGTPQALFDFGQWVHYPNGPTVKNMYTTGVRGDSEWPAVYNGEGPPPGCK